MTELPEKFYGNDPVDIWDEGYLAGQAGRSMDANRYRTGEAERSYQLGQEIAANNGDIPSGSASWFYIPDDDPDKPGWAKGICPDDDT